MRLSLLLIGRFNIWTGVVGGFSVAARDDFCRITLGKNLSFYVKRSIRNNLLSN